MNQLGWAALALAIAMPFACSHAGSVENTSGRVGSEHAALIRTHDGNVEAGYLVHTAAIVPADTRAEPTMSRDDNGEAGRDDHNTE